MQAVALAVIAAAALWLAGVGLLMLLRPEGALRLLRRTATSPMANAVEQIPRMLVGAALIVRAPDAALPDAFEIAGWFVMLSSAVLLAVPLRWHSGYALWWADRLPPLAVRTIGVLSVALAGALVLAAV